MGSSHSLVTLASPRARCGCAAEWALSSRSFVCKYDLKKSGRQQAIVARDRDFKQPQGFKIFQADIENVSGRFFLLTSYLDPFPLPYLHDTMLHQLKLNPRFIGSQLRNPKQMSPSPGSPP